MLNGETFQIVGLCGSLRAQSGTRRALTIALRGAQTAGAHTTLLDLRELNLPFAGGDWTPETFPDVEKLNRLVRQSDALLWATPEYHGSFSGVLKNALDLGSFAEYEGKMVGLLGVAGGQVGALSALGHLRTVARQLHAWVLPNQVSIALASAAFDEAGEVRDEKLRAALEQLGADAVKFARLHSA